MESAEKKRPGDILTGALIGLARTTYSHLKTEDTDRVVTCALSVLARPDAGEEELAQQLKRVRAEKLAVAPGCATCVAKCGNTDDYDMERLWNGPDQVRSLKIRLFSGLKKTGRDAFKVIENGKGKDKHFQSIMESIYKGLFILAEDWEPEEILPAIAELDEAGDHGEGISLKKYFRKLLEKFGKNAKEALRVFNLNRKYKYGKVGIMIKVLKKRGGTEDARAQGRECRQKNVEASFRYFGEKRCHYI